MELWCSNTSDEDFNLTLDDIAEEDENEYEQAHMALAKPSYHVVTSIPRTSHNLDNMEIELKADNSVHSFIKL